MPDPRRRKSRHLLTPELLSSSIQITNLPQSWNQDTITSIVAGSGPITNVSTRTDPRNGKVLGIIVDYATSKDSKRALDILRKIKKFPCELERIIPPNYKDAKKDAAALEFNRDSYPWEFGLELPFELVSEVPLPRRPTNPVPSVNVESNASGSAPTSFPVILSKASKHLPALQPGALTTPDPISMNLSKIPPLQLLEMISNLKILANQDAKRSQLENFLGTNMDISVAVTQAMLEMGFINYNVVTKILTEQQSKVFSPPVQNNSTVYSSGNSQNSTPISNNTVPLNSYVAPPQPLAQPPQQQAPQTMGFNAPSFGFTQASPPPFFAPLAPVNNGTPQINMVKLSSLPQQQQDMIKQVLQLPADQVRLLPPDQIAMVENFKKEYLL
ncbi:LAFE_0D02036g1_1 [Lachancea fermentati]|uniref:LAFE_0D02036g1_1 n=1 Tax=Lachancea fermentati TaxID=4955 RepID=A0A1G4MB80_LACFM|nr:LAFE_0D02036g1_1 [Lachancea fermentati]